MDKSDVARILGLVTLAEGRRFEPAHVEFWFQLLGDLPADLAAAAVQMHYRSSTEMLKPAHIREGVEDLLKLSSGPVLPEELEQLARLSGVSPEEIEARSKLGDEEFLNHLRSQARGVTRGDSD